MQNFNIDNIPQIIKTYDKLPIIIKNKRAIITRINILNFNRDTKEPGRFIKYKDFYEINNIEYDINEQFNLDDNIAPVTITLKNSLEYKIKKEYWKDFYNIFYNIVNNRQKKILPKRFYIDENYDWVKKIDNYVNNIIN